MRRSVSFEEAEAVLVVVVGGELEEVAVLKGLHLVSQPDRHAEGHAGQEKHAGGRGQVVGEAEADEQAAGVEEKDLILYTVEVPGALLALAEVQQLAAVAVV